MKKPPMFWGRLIATGRWVKGWWVIVNKEHYLIFDDAELERIESSYEEGITGFLEVDPETIKPYKRKTP